MSYTYPRFVDYLDADSVSQHLHCPICYEVFQSPIRTPCEHHFCRSCCNEIQSAASIAASVALEVLQCPVCRHIFPLANLVPDRLVQMLTDELIVRCFGAEDGCAWTGPRDRLTVHSTSCEHAPIACSEEAVDAILCKMFLPRRLLAQHKATECLAKLYPKATLAYIGQVSPRSLVAFFLLMSTPLAIPSNKSFIIFHRFSANFQLPPFSAFRMEYLVLLPCFHLQLHPDANYKPLST